LGIPVNRRLVVLALALAMCGTLVAGQTAAPKDVTPTQAQPGRLSGTYANGWGSLLAVRVESVDPQLSRLHLTRNGLDLTRTWTFESTAFTVTPGTSGTIITSSDVVTVTRPGSKVSISGFVLRISSDRTVWTLDGSPISK
jgi:hypothetical protein